MRGYVANTDFGWYRHLSAQPDLDEVNFWFPKPSGLLRAGSTEAVTPFLFKLKAAHDHRICGYGFLVSAVAMPAWFAWETFGTKNGADTAQAFYARIANYRRQAQGPIRRLSIGCLVVVQPTFFDEGAWVDPPEDWKRNIVRGRYYDMREGVGARLWRDCLARAPVRAPAPPLAASPGPTDARRYGAGRIVRPRLGQGAFRVAVTEAYGKACAVTREHSLPVLEAAHIKPYALDGRHEVSNGLALRADLHRLFDQGYVTFDRDHRLVVSRRLQDDYDNGKHYYAMQEAGTRLHQPARPEARPDPDALAWHRDEVFLG